MKLLFDLGNTRWKWSLVHERVIVESGFVEPSRLGDFCIPQLSEIQGVYIASVVSQQSNNLLECWCVDVLGFAPVFVGVRREAFGVRVCYRNIENLGVDRWLSMVGVKSKLNRDAIVVSAGSAITVDYLDARGEHKGGMIIPGVEMMRKALFKNTTAVKLSSLELESHWKPACDTVDCVSAGVSALLLGYIKEVVTKMPGATLVLSGGDSRYLASVYPGDACIEENLVIQGLSVVVA